MTIIIGLLIIAIGAFCQASSYVPINKVKNWSWESYWLVQGLFAWLLLPLFGALLAVPAGHQLYELFVNQPRETLLTIFYGALWGIGGLTFGLSMRYLGVALGQSVALGICAAMGTVLAPIFTGHTERITQPIIIGVIVTLVGISVIGVAGNMKASMLSEEQKKTAVKDFNFTKGVLVALTAGLMSACFNIGLEQGSSIRFAGVDPMFATLPATLLVTVGGFITNAGYCLFCNARNKTFSDYRRLNVWVNNLLFCLLAGALWYSQFFGLALGKGFLESSPTLLTFAFCILMALNVTFSNVWGILLKEWKGCSRKTIIVLVIGLIILSFSSFLPQLLSGK